MYSRETLVSAGTETNYDMTGWRVAQNLHAILCVCVCYLKYWFDCLGDSVLNTSLALE